MYKLGQRKNVQSIANGRGVKRKLYVKKKGVQAVMKRSKAKYIRVRKNV